jgi:hypothetical protein
MDSVSQNALNPQELHQRITTAQAHIIGDLNQLEDTTVQLGNPKSIRQPLDNLREMLNLLWLLYDAALHSSNDQQHQL